MRLYLIHRCPFGHRAAIALREKGLDFDLVFFERGKTPPELTALGPHAKSPTLFDDDGARVYDSQVVLEYLEDGYPAVSLLPASAKERAEVRSFITRISEDLIPDLGAVFAEAFKPRPDPAKIAEASNLCCDRLESWDQRLNGRTFAIGEALSLADITLYTPFVALHGLSGAMIPERWVHLRAWFDRMAARPTTELPAPR